ncbi:MAG: hypothetical protein WCJ62_06780 [Flavobacterium sp.]
MNKKSKIIVVLVVLVEVGYFTLLLVKDYMVNNLGKRDVKSEAAAFTLKSKDIIAEFTANADAANKKYLEKPVAVSGVVSSAKEKEVILDGTVNCGFTVADASMKEGQSVTIKGRVVGYDDLLGELKLDQCSINK